MAKVKPQLAFDLLVLLFFAFLVWEARDWRLQARLFPWAIGIPMFFLSAVLFVRDLTLKDGREKNSSDHTPVDFQFTKGMDPLLARRRVVTMFSWIVGFFVAIWLVGFAISIPALVFLYLKVQSREGWTLSCLLTGGIWLLYWGLFERILNLPLPDGQLFLWLGY